MPKKFDILGFGTVAVDEIIVAETYPPADSKVRVSHAERQCGGLTANALFAATRLGVKCAYAGVLGYDELSEFAIGQLAEEKIDLHFLRRHDKAPPVHSFIVVDQQKQTRNVFSHRAVAYELGANWPPPNVIESAKVLFVDHSNLKGMIRAARIARAAGIPVVADLERVSGSEFSTLVSLVDHLILSRKFAEKFTGARNPTEVVRHLWSSDKKVVALTYGKRGCWYWDGVGKPQHQRAFVVDAVDTTGCGDVFHGAYAAGLVNGLTLKERIVRATAAAALQATKLGGQAGIPNARQLSAFLAARQGKRR